MLIIHTTNLLLGWFAAAIVDEQCSARFFVLVHEFRDTTTLFNLGLVPSELGTHFIERICNEKLFLGLFIDKRQ